MTDYQQYFDENEESDESSSRRNLRPKRTERQLVKLVGDSKFLDDFNPELSTREKRKLSRRNYTPQTSNKSGLFDERGRYRSTGANVCDCLDNNCAGCQFPCPQCRSNRCGTTCRVNRKWAFETTEHDGKDLVIKNKNITVK